MFREIITPASQEITLKIPSAYLNKKLEVLVFEVNEGLEVKPNEELVVMDAAAQLTMAKEIMDENVDVLRKLAR